MGPRSGERGNLELMEQTVKVLEELQWGHVQVNVETIVFYLSFSLSECFNGATFR